MQIAQGCAELVARIWREGIECHRRSLLFNGFLELTHAREHLSILIERFSRTGIAFQRRPILFRRAGKIAPVAQDIGQCGMRFGQLRIDA